VRRRLLESFGSFPDSSWFEAFAEDVRGARNVRIASGFMDLRGARDLLEHLDPTTHVDVLLALAGCSGPEVIEELQKRSDLEVRGSRNIEFHWKLVSIESKLDRVIFLGSANLTHKGISGRGEIMLRMTGSVLDSGCWDAIQGEFAEYFAKDKTLTASQMRSILARVDVQGDEARNAKAKFEEAIEQVLDEENTATALATERIWLVVWDSDLTPRELALTERVMGPSRPESKWIRGEMEACGEQVQEGAVVLCFCRDESRYLLGRVGQLRKVPFGRRGELLFADLEYLCLPLVRVRLGGDTTSTENPPAYDGIALAIGGQEDGFRMPRRASQRVLAVLKEFGLLLSTH
jgi:hypothetical protein